MEATRDPRETTREPRPRFESLLELQEAHEDLLQRVQAPAGDASAEPREDRTIAQLQAELSDFLAGGAATGTVLDELRERVAAQTLLDYWVNLMKRAGLTARRPRLAAFDEASLPALPDDRCPYVGLESFTDGAYFFGRDGVTRDLVARLADSPLVVVHGPSGCGKSSLVLGGALPRVRDEVPPRWTVCAPFTPGSDAMAHLVAAVLDALGRRDEHGELLARARQEPAALGQALDAAKPLLITVDQFEEVFTLTDEAGRRAFAGALAGVLAAEGRHRVLLTVREEFYDKLFRLTELVAYLKAADFSLRPMDAHELRAAIEGPAAKVNLNIDRHVVEGLVGDVLGQAAALPLLQFTLRNLWARRPEGRNRITRETLESVGGPLVALERFADEFIEGLIPEDRDEARRILLELVRVDNLLEPYRQPLPIGELLAAGRANTQKVVDLLQQHDFVRVRPGERPDDAIAEIKHEALLRNWTTLKKWIDDKRLAHRSRLELQEAARRWSARHGVDELYRGWKLEEASHFAGTSKLEEEFIAASKAAAERELHTLKRQRRTLVIVFSTVLAALTVSTIGGVVWGQKLYLGLKQDYQDKENELILKKGELTITEGELKQTVERLAEKEREGREIQDRFERASGGLDLKSQAFSESSKELSTLLRKQDITAKAAEITAKAAEIPRGTTVAVMYSNERSKKVSELDAVLRAQGLQVLGPTYMPLKESNVRWFHKSDAARAAKVQELLEIVGIEADLSDKTGDPQYNARTGLVEIWIGKDAPLTAYDIAGDYSLAPVNGKTGDHSLAPEGGKITIGALSRTRVQISDSGSWSWSVEAEFDGRTLLGKEIGFTTDLSMMDISATLQADGAGFNPVTYSFSRDSRGEPSSAVQVYRWTLLQSVKPAAAVKKSPIRKDATF
jgi:hypothetical protein